MRLSPAHPPHSPPHRRHQRAKQLLSDALAEAAKGTARDTKAADVLLFLQEAEAAATGAIAAVPHPEPALFETRSSIRAKRHEYESSYEAFIHRLEQAAGSGGGAQATRHESYYQAALEDAVMAQDVAATNAHLARSRGRGGSAATRRRAESKLREGRALLGMGRPDQAPPAL